MGPSGLFRRRTNPPKKEENNKWNEPTENIEKETKLLNVNADFDTHQHQITAPKSILKRRELPISPLSVSTQSIHGGDKYRRSGTASVDTSAMKSHDSLAFQSIPLPDWESAIDDKTNRKYYYNTLSLESQWTEPIDYHEKWNQYRQAINKYRQGHVTKNYTSEGLRKPGKSASSDKYATPEDAISISDTISSSSTFRTVRTRVETQISPFHQEKNSATDGVVRSRSKRFGIFSSRKNSNERELDTKENTKKADTNSQLPTRKENIFRKPKKLAFFTSSNMNPAHAHNIKQTAAEEPEWDKESVLKALGELGRHRQDFITSGRSMQDLSVGKSFADSVDDCSTQFSNSRFSEVETQADEDEITYFTTGTDDDRTNFDSREDGSYFTLETPASSFKSSYDRDDADGEDEAKDRDDDDSMEEIKFAPSMHSGLYSEISQPPPPPPPPPPTSNQKINTFGSKIGEYDDETNLPNAKSFVSMTDYSTAVDTFATDADDSVGTGIETVVRAQSFITAKTTRSLNDFKNNLIMGDGLLFGDSACRTSCTDVGEPIPMETYRVPANLRKMRNTGRSRSMPRSKPRRHPQRLEF